MWKNEGFTFNSFSVPKKRKIAAIKTDRARPFETIEFEFLEVATVQIRIFINVVPDRYL